MIGLFCPVLYSILPLHFLRKVYLSRQRKYTTNKIQLGNQLLANFKSKFNQLFLMKLFVLKHNRLYAFLQMSGLGNGNVLGFGTDTGMLFLAMAMMARIGLTLDWAMVTVTGQFLIFFGS